jgi:hypothetical protein
MTKSILASVLAIGFLSGCATSMRSPSNGFLYSDVYSGVTATANQTGNRVGEACSSSILGLVGVGDSSIEAARRNGGITMISTVDESFKNYVGAYSTHCTIVRGR